MAKLPTIAAYAYKKSVGQPFLYPDNSLSLTENFLRMTFGFPAEPYDLDPDLVKALDLLLILHADHEQNCSTSTVRLVGSSQANLFASISAGHQRAVRAAARRREPVGAGDARADQGRRRRRRHVRPQGQEQGGRRQAHGLRAPRLQELRPARGDREEDRRQDPRTRAACSDELLDIALKLEQTALEDDYFVERKLYPNVDFYTGLIYKSMGFPTRMFTVAVRPGPPAGLDRPVARDDRGPPDQDRPPPPDLRRRHRARLRRPRPALTQRPSLPNEARTVRHGAGLVRCAPPGWSAGEGHGDGLAGIGSGRLPGSGALATSSRPCPGCGSTRGRPRAPCHAVRDGHGRRPTRRRAQACSGGAGRHRQGPVPWGARWAPSSVLSRRRRRRGRRCSAASRRQRESGRGVPADRRGPGSGPPARGRRRPRGRRCAAPPGRPW